MSATVAAQDPLQSLVDELFQDDDENAVMYSPSSSMEPMEYTPAPTPRKRSKKTTATWELRNTQDAPFISWTDANFQYNVQNAANYGDLLLKIQMFNGGRPINSCGLYLNSDSDAAIMSELKELLCKLENMWVDRSNGNVPRVEGLQQSLALLPSWRIISEPTVQKDDIKLRAKTARKNGGKQRRVITKKEKNRCGSRKPVGAKKRPHPSDESCYTTITPPINSPPV